MEIKNDSKTPNQAFSENTVAIYTMLSVLQKMRRQLGLEAMLDYVGSYMGTIEAHNPKVRLAVAIATKMIDVEKIYKEAKVSKGAKS